MKENSTQTPTLSKTVRQIEEILETSRFYLIEINLSAVTF